MPNRLRYRDVEGNDHDLMSDFVEQEWAIYPSVTHDDMLDCLANMYHPSVVTQTSFPVSPNALSDPNAKYDAIFGKKPNQSGSLFAR